MRPIIFLLYFVTLLVSCSDDNVSHSGKNYQIPRFAVYPPSDSGIPQGGFAGIFSPQSSNKLGYYVLAPLNFLLPPAHAQGRIDCTDEVSFWNSAPQTMGRAASIPAEELIHHFYAQALFYDCNVREQAQNFGIGETVQQDGENGGEEVTILTASNIGAIEDDLTQFVSWTDLPESENVRGLLVNKYLQNDGTRTKTRVDLEIENGARHVTSLLHFTTEDNGEYYSKASFQESGPDEDGNFQKHEIWGRYYDTSSGGNTVVQIRAVAETNGGYSFEIKRCSGVSDKNSPCASPPTIKHYDKDKNEINARTFGSNENEADNFYEGEEESDYFTPEFSLD